MVGMRSIVGEQTLLLQHSKLPMDPGYSVFRCAYLRILDIWMSVCFLHTDAENKDKGKGITNQALHYNGSVLIISCDESVTNMNHYLPPDTLVIHRG